MPLSEITDLRRLRPGNYAEIGLVGFFWVLERLR
jgi:hypothetical protein